MNSLLHESRQPEVEAPEWLMPQATRSLTHGISQQFNERGVHSFVRVGVGQQLSVAGQDVHGLQGARG
jgi:hypothetical protein